MRRRALALVSLVLACGDPPSRMPFVWQVDLSRLEDALLSVWTGGADEAIAVGGAGGRGVVLEWDGQRWDAPDLPDDTPALWWIWALPGGDAFAVGEGATVLRRSAGLWRRELVSDQVAADQTLYGVIGFGDDDVWVVGGTLTPRPDPGVIVHWDGVTWSGQPAEALLFKVWGAAPDDLWAVGEGGAILHGDGASFSPVSSPTTDRLIAVYGRSGGDVYAVGGSPAAGIVLAWDGAAWSTLAGTPEALAGVWTAPGRPLYVGGARGYVARLGTDPAEAVLVPDVDFHALAGAGDRVVAVGADLQAGGAGGWRGTLASHGPSLAGPVEPRSDAPPASDGPAADAPPDGSGPGEGEPCDRPDGGGTFECRDGLECWLILDDGAVICTETCAGPVDCAAYGAGACCTVPGPQTLETVCIPRGHSPCP